MADRHPSEYKILVRDLAAEMNGEVESKPYTREELDDIAALVFIDPHGHAHMTGDQWRRVHEIARAGLADSERPCTSCGVSLSPQPTQCHDCLVKALDRLKAELFPDSVSQLRRQRAPLEER